MKIAVTYENGQIFQHFGHTGAVDKHPNFHSKFTSIWYNKKNGRGVKL